MISIKSREELIQRLPSDSKSFLLLYKSSGEQSLCAIRNLGSALNNHTEIPVFTADVAEVRDIHSHYGVSTVPSLLVFDSTQLASVVKGCQEPGFYKALTDNAIYQAKAKAEGKEPKRVTVYSTPTCSWCNTLKSWLRKNNIPYTDVDVSRDERAAQDLVRRTGQQGVPQTDINGQVVVGFNQQRLKELLEIQ